MKKEKVKHKIIKNFLDINSFEKIKNLVTDKDFPWRRRDHTTELVDNKMFFSHSFYFGMMPTSDLYRPYIVPILKKLKATAPVGVRANMFVSALIKDSPWHRDLDFDCRTAILYLNDCDGEGGTQLKINNKIIFIKAEANKLLVFDTLTMHKVIPFKESVRYIINFNYYE